MWSKCMRALDKLIKEALCIALKRLKFVLITNSTSHTGFRLVPTSVTFNDLERRNGPYFAFWTYFTEFDSYADRLGLRHNGWRQTYNVCRISFSTCSQKPNLTHSAVSLRWTSLFHFPRIACPTKCGPGSGCCITLHHLPFNASLLNVGYINETNVLPPCDNNTREKTHWARSIDILISKFRAAPQEIDRATEYDCDIKQATCCF